MIAVSDTANITIIHTEMEIDRDHVQDGPIVRFPNQPVSILAVDK